MCRERFWSSGSSMPRNARSKAFCVQRLEGAGSGAGKSTRAPTRTPGSFPARMARQTRSAVNPESASRIALLSKCWYARIVYIS